MSQKGQAGSTAHIGHAVHAWMEECLYKYFGDAGNERGKYHSQATCSPQDSEVNVILGRSPDLQAGSD